MLLMSDWQRISGFYIDDESTKSPVINLARNVADSQPVRRGNLRWGGRGVMAAPTGLDREGVCGGLRQPRHPPRECIDNAATFTLEPPLGTEDTSSS